MGEGVVNGMTGAEVLAMRQRLGLTQEQLASKTGVSVRTIARWEERGCSRLAAKFLTSLTEGW